MYDWGSRCGIGCGCGIGEVREVCRAVADSLGVELQEYLGYWIVTDDWTWAYLSPDGPDSVPFEVISNIWFCD